MEICALSGFFSPAQRARFLSAVAQRRSVRAYRGEPDVAQMSALHYAAARVCLPGVRIAIGDADEEDLYRHLPLVGGVTGTSRYAAIIVDDAAPHALAHAGISGEALILEAASLGLGSCWVASFKRKGVNVPLEEGEKVVAVTPLGIPNEVDRGRKRKKLTEICQGDPALWPLWAYNAAECVRQAPSALNRQPWHLSFAGRTMQLSKERMGSELDMGIALLHMSLGAGETPHELRWGESREYASLVAEDPVL